MRSKAFSPCPYCDGRNNNCADCELQAYRALGTVKDLSALVKARDEGRVVVLPCKVGDTVYAIDNSWSGTVGEIVINDDGITLYIRCGGGEFYARPNDVRFARAEAEAALTRGGEDG